MFVVGVNYHIYPANERSKYSLNTDQQVSLYKLINSYSDTSCIIINTCNRTEIYGMGNADKVIELYNEVLGGNSLLPGFVFKKTGHDAIEHIFKVACGLDSQVVGDLEILGQFKSAFRFAKQNKAVNGYIERLANTAIQTAKEVRSKTKISSGTISLSYAATKYIKRTSNNNTLKILIVGTGAFGKRIINNVKDYLPQAKLTLCNRTASRAEELAVQFNCDTHPFENLSAAIAENNVIISSVNVTDNYLIDETMAPIISVHSKVFIDMSIPFSIDPKLAAHGHKLVNIDDISKEINQTIDSRKQDIPLALEIIDKNVQQFKTWAEVFEKSASIQHWKKIVLELSHTCPRLSKMADEDKNRVVGKSLADFALYVKQSSNLPNETEKIIYHYLAESVKPIVCHKAAVRQDLKFTHNCSACHSS